jgi:hypothetical protein
MQDTRGIVFVGERQIRGDQCLHEMLGSFIDVEWSIKTGVMRLSSTKHHSFSHTISNDTEVINYIPLRHGANCPLLNNAIAKNQQRPMRPCSVVLL